MSETASTYVETKRGPLKHVWWDTQPLQHGGMIEETWKLGPFSLERHYVREDKSYGSWLFSFMLALRRWRGPWFQIAFGTGAQDWDEE